MLKPVNNPPNPFHSHCIEYLDGLTPQTNIQIFEDATRSILARNDSPDLTHRWSLNPYRGCTHACSYCYARPSHEYLDFGAGTDFETKIVIKKKAPELLRQTFLKKNWKGEEILFSGDTDCYQPLEACYELTRECLKVCLEFGNPLSIITKSFLMIRDLDLLSALHERTHLFVTVSIPFWNESDARKMEPNAASVRKRFEAVELLAKRGIKVGLLVAPLIPGLNDSDIPSILKEAARRGAQYAEPILLRLPGSVKPVFEERIRQLYPMRTDKILSRMRSMRGGKLYDSTFGNRHRGHGPYWDNLEKIFRMTCRRLGLNRSVTMPQRPGFLRPGLQKELF
ncbi:MAG: PA0069 family radical SAM protein [Candidatus Omnitrophica bacterium]|nr:PA0069 family radical SAM protein [Candidatus Omnitrophota bacterium]